jgi:photosystem II stability/assembly factor-like uncharacterized protein
MIRALATALCAIALWAPSPGAAAIDLRPELDPGGPIGHPGWTPEGNLWFGTDQGRVFVSRDGGHGWSEVAVAPHRAHGRDDIEASVSGDTIDWVQFFDAKRGLALGWWRGGGQPAVFRTADGGASWQPLSSPPGFLIEDAQVTPEGRAWLMGESRIAASEDYGATWRSLTSPPTDERLLSIHFSSPSEGFLGTWHSLFLTSDGGASWRSLPAPAAQAGLVPGCSGSDQAIRKIRRWGGRLLVHQCGSWFASPFPETATADIPPAGALQWQPLLADGWWLFELEPMGERLLTIAGNGEILFLDRNLQVVARPGFKLRYEPRDVAVLGDHVAIVDEPGHLTVGENGRFAKVPLLEAGAARSTAPSEVRIYDRGADGSLWGLSTFFLQRSRDGGRTWERQAELPYSPGGLALRASGEVLLWTREGGALSYDPRASTFTPVPELKDLDVIGLFRRGPLWLLYGGLEHKTNGKVLRSPALDESRYAGQANEGFVEVSTDGGGHWQALDNRIEGSGVQAIFLADDNRLTLLTWLGSVLRGKLAIDAKGRASAAMTTVFRGEGDFGDSAEWLDFLGGNKGWIRGWSGDWGFRLFQTRDGGRTWTLADLSKRHFVSLTRLGSGVWLAPVRIDRSLMRWDGKRFRLEKRFDDMIDETWTDSTGGLVVKLEHGQLWALDAAGKSWTRLR